MRAQVNFKEDFLQYVWKTKNFNFKSLHTIDGKQVLIKQFGQHNFNAGPDFLGAELMIDQQHWFGHIEIHVRSSDWYKHKHQKDKNYNAVILHVAYIHDKDILNAAGQKVPAISLGGLVDEQLIDNYTKFQINKKFIPCERSLPYIDIEMIELFKESWLIERLMNKSEIFSRIHRETQFDWQTTFYRIFMRSLGANINQDAFEALAISLPYKLLLKYRDNPTQIAALLFGQSGMLDQSLDSYMHHLQKEYKFLRNKHKLTPIKKVQWKFARMRPTAFPSMRIAAISEWIIANDDILFQLLERKSFNMVYECLKLELNPYWDNHFQLGILSKQKRRKRISKALVRQILINALLPFLCFRAKVEENDEVKYEVIEIFRNMASEQNRILGNWEALNQKNINAFDSQSLLHLYKNYCNLNACLKCKIGHQIIKGI